ncbi:4117_t:CDS:2 [Entrophospora sp. SA101]|nr:4117_t:CDS:2 [Entrophospora sp. SA101]
MCKIFLKTLISAERLQDGGGNNNYFKASQKFIQLQLLQQFVQGQVTIPTNHFDFGELSIFNKDDYTNILRDHEELKSEIKKLVNENNKITHDLNITHDYLVSKCNELTELTKLENENNKLIVNKLESEVNKLKSENNELESNESKNLELKAV